MAVVAGEIRPEVQDIIDRGWDDIEVQNFGKVWETDAEGKWLLPVHTLGWQILAWCDRYLLGDQRDAFGAKQPFTFSDEQLRFLLWWYAVDEHGKWVYESGTLQRIKGWGKDPLIAIICLIELLGPAEFYGWLTEEDRPDLGLRVGDPVGIPRSQTWVDVAAVTREQTWNTFELFRPMLRKEDLPELGLTESKFGKFGLTGPTTSHRLKGLTSNPGALEGNRPNLVIVNEPHQWNASNKGVGMWEVITRNRVKIGRVLIITNAPNPAVDSIGLEMRRQVEQVWAGERFETAGFYDTREVARRHGLQPPELVMWDDEHPDEEPLNPKEQEAITRAWLRTLIIAARGDSVWVDPDPKIDALFSGALTESQFRRFFLNQTDSDEEAWIPAECVAAAAHPMVKPLRLAGEDQTRIGWELVSAADPIVIFADGSKSGDDTGIVGCRLSDGYTFVIGHWHRPHNLPKSAIWRVPRNEFLERMHEAKQRFNVVAWWMDPSHAKDDESESESYWGPTLQQLHRAYAQDLSHDYWPVKSGIGVHSIKWDMTSPERTRQFVEATMEVRTELSAGYEDGYSAPEFFHDGHPALMAHFRHCHAVGVTYVGGFRGTAVRKQSPDSRLKIDLAVCAIGSRMLRNVVRNAMSAQPGESYGFVVAY